MIRIRTKSLLWVPAVAFASLLMTGCNSEETAKTETSTTETTTTTQEPQMKSQDSLPPLDSSAVTKPEDKLNTPSK